MSIPPSVSRRADQAAIDGQNSAFFDGCRFVRSSGGPDEYVAVTCRRLAAAPGRRSLIEVQVHFDVETPVLHLRPGATTPAFEAEIFYNGTGRLQGRGEVVAPGEEPPAERDLLTEATLPPEERGPQRRFTQLARFNEYLPPSGASRYPDLTRRPLRPKPRGHISILLRIEASTIARPVQARTGRGRRRCRPGRSCRGVFDARVAVRRRAGRRQRARGEDRAIGSGSAGASRGRDRASPEWRFTSAGRRTAGRPTTDSRSWIPWSSRS